MMKKIMPVVVLTLICIVIGGLLAGINMLTGPEIARMENEKVTASLKLVMPDGEFDSEPEPLKEGAPATVKAVYPDKNGKGHVVVLVTNKGYTGKEIGITVGIDTEGRIIDALITKNEESIVPPDMKPMGSYGNAYAGADADSVTDLVTGATVKYTEAAIKNALYDAFVYLGYTEEPEEPTLPKTDAEILALAGELIPDAQSFEDLSGALSADSTVKRLYAETSGKGYIAYTVTSTQYVAVETEGIIHISEDGKVANLKMLTWTVGHDVDYTEAFVNGFIGKSASDLESVDLVTGATGTAEHFRDAVAEALKVANEQGTDAEIISVVNDMLDGQVEYERISTEGAGDTLKKAFRVTLGDDEYYVAYTVTSTQYVAVESEVVTLINCDTKKIAAIKILTWTVGHGVDYTEAFVNSFVGKDASDLSGVDLVTGATGTAEHIRDAVAGALDDLTSDAIRTDRQIINTVKEMLGGDVEYEKLPVDNAYPTLLKAFKVAYDGNEYYVAYTLTSTQYVAVESEAITLIDCSNGKIADLKILTWTVGHGVDYTEEFVNSFIGKGISDIGSVDLVSGATGTAEHVRDAVAGALELLGSNIIRTDRYLAGVAGEMLGGDVEYERIYVEGASDTLAKALKIKYAGKYYYLVYTVTSTQYVAVETEAVTLVDGRNGKIVDLEVLTWTVGHGVDYTEAFVNSFIGKKANNLEKKVELVTEATGTSEHLRDAVVSAVSAVAPTVPYARYISIAILATVIVGFIGVTVFVRQRRKIK